MNKLIMGTAIIITSLLPIETQAAPIVRTLTQSQVSGETAQVQNIKVWNGNGVSISFYEVNEMIKRIWIDDPSQILIDMDGCLEGINPTCKNSGAGLIHLRRIQKLNIPGLPQSSSTHLTIITQAPDGTRRAYHFQVSPVEGRPEYSQISILGDGNNETIAKRSAQRAIVRTTKHHNRKPHTLSNTGVSVK